jgi:hypothetical protein
MAIKKKSAEASDPKDLARRLAKTKAVLKRHQAVLRKVTQLLRATERLVHSISTPPPSTGI